MKYFTFIIISLSNSTIISWFDKLLLSPINFNLIEYILFSIQFSSLNINNYNYKFI